MPFKKENRTDFLPLAFLLIAWAWFHHRVLFGGTAFVLEDSSRFFFPLWKWGSEVWAKGWIPLWNPDAGFGTPYLADPQMAAWYPPVYFFYRIFNPITAFNLLISGHHLFALFGFYCFARKKGFSPWAALNGGILFGFSFNAISLTWACPMLFTYAWIPWIFMAANGVKNRRPGWFLVLSFTLAMQLAAGYPIFFYLTLLTLLLETVFDKKEGENWKRDVPMGLGAIVIALLYNAAWLVPFKEFIPFSNLAQRASYSESLGWSDLGSWLNPFLKGHPLYSHPETPFSVTIYFVGLPLLVLLIWGIAARKVKFVPVFVFLVLLVLSLGQTAFLGEWLKTLLPGYSLLVRSGYWIPFVIWAALGVFLEAVTEVDSSDETNPKAKAGLWSITVVLVYGSALVAGVPWDLGSFWISLAFLLAVGLSRPFSPELRPIFLALAILFSLWPMAQSMNFTMDRSYYEDRPAILSLTTLPGRLYQSSLWVDSLKTISGDSVSDAYEKLKQTVSPNAPLGWDKEEVSFANSLFLKSFLKWYLWTDHTDEKTARKLLDFLNVRYGIGPRPSSHSEFLKSVGNLVPLFENATMLPKWFSVTQALPLTEGQNTDQEILNPSFDLGEKCFVADEAEAGVYHHRIVEELDRAACRVHLKATGKGKGFLVSSDTAYPGWRAQVNGVEKPVELVDQAFRGIVLADGEEDVQLNYAPTSFRLGCFLSLCICGLWFGGILRMFRGQHA